MRHCQIQCNLGGIDDLCKLGKEYSTALICKLYISFETKFWNFSRITCLSIISHCKVISKTVRFLAYPVIIPPCKPGTLVFYKTQFVKYSQVFFTRCVLCRRRYGKAARFTVKYNLKFVEYFVLNNKSILPSTSTVLFIVFTIYTVSVKTRSLLRSQINLTS